MPSLLHAPAIRKPNQDVRNLDFWPRPGHLDGRIEKRMKEHETSHEEKNLWRISSARKKKRTKSDCVKDGVLKSWLNEWNRHVFKKLI